MNLRPLSGTILLLGFGLIVVGVVLSPPNLYQASDLNAQLQILAQHSTRFAASQVFSLAGILVVAAGYVLFALSLRGLQKPGLPYAGAAAFVLASIAVTIAVYPSLSDPAAFLESGLDTPWAVAFVWSTILGHILSGIVFLAGSFPRWLGYGTIGAAALAAVGIVLVDAAIVELLFILPLVVGIVLVRRPRRQAQAAMAGGAL